MYDFCSLLFSSCAFYCLSCFVLHIYSCIYVSSFKVLVLLIILLTDNLAMVRLHAIAVSAGRVSFCIDTQTYSEGTTYIV